MIKVVISLYCLFAAVTQGWCGKLFFLRGPSNLQFSASDPLQMQDLTGVFSAALGLSQDFKWPGLKFKGDKIYPEALVTLIIEGPIEFNNSLAHYKLKSNHELKSFQDGMKNSVTNFFPNEKVTVADVDFESTEKLPADFPSFLKELPEDTELAFHHLKKDNPVVAQLARELHALVSAASKIAKESELNNKISDVFWFHVRALKPIAAQFGENSPEAEEARSLIRSAVVTLEEAFQTVYGEKFLFAVLSMHQHHHSRHARATDGQTDKFAHLNLSKEYDENYSAIFNILLWTSIALIWILIATAGFIGSMDPGRDSIIYRMTSQRMKKDN